MNNIQLIDEDYIGLIDNTVKCLLEPILFIRILEKRLMLESLRELKQEVDIVITEIDNCKSVKSIYDNLLNSTMTMVYKFRNVHEHFNRTFNADAYINMKIEEWRRYLRSSQAYIKVNDLKDRVMSFKNKINVDFEIEQYALMEATNKWIELMIKTREMNKIFNESITMNTTSIDESF